jgi:hypothetical protein
VKAVVAIAAGRRGTEGTEAPPEKSKYRIIIRILKENLLF